MTALRVVRTLLVGSAALAVVLLAWVAVAGPKASAGVPVTVGSTTMTVGLYVDVVSAALLVLVVAVGALAAAFSVRHLVGGDRLSRYAALQAAMVAGLALAVTAASLPVLVVGWTLSGLALAALVAHARSATAAAASRYVRTRLLAGDALMLTGVLLAAATLPSLDRADLADAVASADPSLLTGATLALLAGAAVRSALVPFHRWLPETAEAPTPVSALLHAGLVNGVGIVGVLAWPMLAVSWPVLVVLVVLGVASAAIGTLLGKPRPDTKGRLAASTTAQMGYLAVQVGLALPAAALFHLIGHALYKATLFLGAGSTVAQAARPVRPSPGPRLVAACTVGTASLTALVTGGLLTIWPQADKGVAGLVPLGLAAAVAGVALARVLADDRASTGGRRVAALAVWATLGAFVTVIVAWTNALAASFPTPSSLNETATATLVAIVVLVAGTAVVVEAAMRRGRLRRLAVRLALQSGPARGPLGRRVGRVLPGERRRPSDADVARTQALVQLAADAVAPTWPLSGYVAANPIAGLERMSYPDALAAASAIWGDRAELSDELFRRYHASGRISDEHLDAVIGDRPDRDVVRRLLVTSPLASTQIDAAAEQAVSRLPRDVLPPLPSSSWTGRTAVELLDGLLERDATSHVDAHASAWSALVHGSPTAWMARPATLYTTWREAMGTGAVDRALGVRGAGDLATALPERSDVAVAVLLDRLDVPHKQRLGYLSRTLARTPGWAAHQAWRASQQTGDDLADLLAVRLALEVILVEAVTTQALGRPARWPELVALCDDSSDWGPGGEPVLDGQRRHHAARLLARAAAALGWDECRLASATDEQLRQVLAAAAELTPATRVELWQAALEQGYLATLLDALRPRAAAAGRRPDEVRAQVVTCIDVRSERLRRQLEECSDVETLGFAGFFGVPFRLADESGVSTAQCPVLISPANTVRSRPQDLPVWTAAGSATGRALAAAQQAPLLPLVLAEASGWAMGAVAALRTAAPRLCDSVISRVTALEQSSLTVHDNDGFGFTRGERVYLAEAALRSMGLVEGFAPFVLLLGHASRVTNNPFASGYDCGACGGNGGLVNARVAAAILNDPLVREGLRERGIDVPDSTIVVPGLHETTRDRVTLLPEVEMTPRQHELLETVQADLDRAAQATAVERQVLLPGATSSQARLDIDRRAGDWAETRPEWGLAGNAALVIGPRELTRGLNLAGRTFLHSYRAEADPDSAALEVILTAPLVVAQWINSGYGFATLDPGRFGAGDKVLHNPVGAIGVQRGAHGDLQLGLPLQAVTAGSASRDALPAHEPVRLSVVVAASRDAVGRIIDRQPSVRQLVAGRWIMLLVLESGSSTVWRWTDDGWVEFLPEDDRSSRVVDEQEVAV